MGFTYKFGAMNSDDFLAFLLMMIKKNEEIDKNLHRYVVYADGAMIHRTKKISQELNKFIRVIIGPPYSPDLNPIETIFSFMKKEMKKKNCSNEEEIISGYYEVQERISIELIGNIICNYTDYALKAMKNEDL